MANVFRVQKSNILWIKYPFDKIVIIIITTVKSEKSNKMKRLLKNFLCKLSLNR